MKAITIYQPWAQLACTPNKANPHIGIKNIENRTWRTYHTGGRVLIHAAAKRKNINVLTPAQWDEIGEEARMDCVLNSYPIGAIIGSVEIVDCVINHSSIWAEKSELITDSNKICKPRRIYNWVLANPILFREPIPYKGQQGFWEFPDELLPVCTCEMPAKVKGKNECWRCRKPLKELL